MNPWAWWRNRARLESELEEEIQTHLRLAERDRIERGETAAEARANVRREFGNVLLTKEVTRAQWGWVWLDQFVFDIRYVLRGLWRSPGFAMLAMLSLALGIGATTAVFSVLNAVLLRPLPVPEPERLVVIQPKLQGDRFVLFNQLFEELRRSQRSLAGMFAVSDEPYLKATFGRAAPVYVRGSLVSGNYFQVLGLSPASGRLLTADDDESSAETCAAVISHTFWMTTLHRDPAVLGRPVIVREKVCTIVGVAPVGFRGIEQGYAPDLWVPLRPLTDPKLLASRGMAFFTGVMGRLRSKTTRAQAETELTALTRACRKPNHHLPAPGKRLQSQMTTGSRLHSEHRAWTGCDASSASRSHWRWLW